MKNNDNPLLNIKVEEIANKALKEVKTLFTDALDAIFLKERSLEELRDIYSDSVDKVILKTLDDDKQLTFIAGEFIFQHSADNKHQALAKLYFNNKEKEWIVEELTSYFQNKDLTKEAIDILNSKKTIKYSIVSPIN